MIEQPESFTYRSARSGSLVAGLALAIAIETIVLHLWLMPRHPVIAWTLTVSSIGALVWLAGDYHALGRGAVRVTSQTIDLRIGRRFAVQLPTAAIAQVAQPGWRDLPAPGTPEAIGYINLTKPATPNVMLTLAEPLAVRLPGGIRRSASRLALMLDDPGAFIAAVRREPRSTDGAALTIAREPITSADAMALIRALNAELSARYPEPGATHFRLDAEEVAPGSGAFLVARLDGRPIGCGAVRRLRDAALVREVGADVGEVKRMYVAREGRGRGIGRALLARLEGEARALGLTRLVLETGIRQPEAIRLYRGTGFTDIPPYGEYSLSSATSVCMTKTL